MTLIHMRSFFLQMMEMGTRRRWRARCLSWRRWREKEELEEARRAASGTPATTLAFREAYNTVLHRGRDFAGALLFEINQRFTDEDMDIGKSLESIFTPALHGKDSENVEEPHEALERHFSQRAAGSAATHFYISSEEYSAAKISINRMATRHRNLQSHEFAQACLSQWGGDHPVGKLATLSSPSRR